MHGGLWYMGQKRMDAQLLCIVLALTMFGLAAHRSYVWSQTHMDHRFVIHHMTMYTRSYVFYIGERQMGHTSGAR